MTEALKVGALDDRSLLLVSPTPPPSFGMSTLTPGLLEHLRRSWRLHHIDTADRRSLSTMGGLDLTNVILAMRHGAAFLARLLVCWPRVVYVPIAQNRLGLLRDALFLVPARLTRRRLVVHLHGSQFPDFFSNLSSPEKVLARYSLSGASRAIVLGECLRGVFAGIVPDDRIRVVWNGVADHGHPEQQSAGSAPKMVLYLGTLLAEKGLLDVLAAAATVVSEMPYTRFVFAGGWARGGRDRPKADAIVRRYHLEGVVSFVGPVGEAEKRRLLAAADVLAFPPVWKEGQSLVVLEALSAGVPVVTTRSGALSETIHHGVQGLFVQPADPRDLADAILRILRDDELHHRMSDAARLLYLSRYTIESWHSRLEAVLLEAAQSPF